MPAEGLDVTSRTTRELSGAEDASASLASDVLAPILSE
jgi:hypothetical protein